MIVVTGPMRSGTSAVAKMLHQMGVIMGETQAMVPVYGMDPEYEDHALASLLSAHAHGTDVDWGRFLPAYFCGRAMHFSGVLSLYGDVCGWGVKSPMLALIWDQFMDMAPDPVTVICTQRSGDDTRNSLRVSNDRLLPGLRGMAFETLESIQSEIERALPAIEAVSDLVVPIDEMKKHPRVVARKIANAVGVEYSDDAIAGIRRE